MVKKNQNENEMKSTWWWWWWHHCDCGGGGGDGDIILVYIGYNYLVQCWWVCVCLCVCPCVSVWISQKKLANGLSSFYFGMVFFSCILFRGYFYRCFFFHNNNNNKSWITNQRFQSDDDLSLENENKKKNFKQTLGQAKWKKNIHIIHTYHK